MPAMDRRQFATLVRQAVGHLYDQAYLQRHPLAELLTPAAAAEAKGYMLHRLLLEAIGALRPPPRTSPSTAAWRSYLAISLRWLDGLDREQVAQELGISPRQLRREQMKGLAALSDILWTRYLQQQGELQQVELPQALLDAEVARLGTAPSGGGTSLAAAVQGVLALIEGLAARQQISIAAHLPDALPPVAVERVVLRQILLNALSHVLEKGAGGSVEITARPAEQWVLLLIEHHGKAPAAAPLDPISSRLAVVARLLETQGGEMALASDGSPQVQLSLPVQKAPQVLVIDDNPEVIQLFQRYLGGGAYRVVGATSGTEALQLAQRIRPQVITLDVMMAGQDGWEILQNLKAQPATKNIPVIVCSVLRERDLALHLGASGFLAKPVTQQMLLAQLAECLAGSAESARPDRP